jgi:hypothetical protein
MKLRDAVGQFQDYYLKMVVWDEVAAHLRKYVSEGGVLPEKTIKAGQGTQGVVPEEIILGIIREISDGPMEALEAELEKLGDLQVQQPPKRKSVPRGKAAKKADSAAEAPAGVRGAQGKGRRKPLRAVD